MNLKTIAVVSAGVFVGQMAAPYVIGLSGVMQDPTKFGMDDIIATLVVAVAVCGAMKIAKAV